MKKVMDESNLIREQKGIYIWTRGIIKTGWTNCSWDIERDQRFEYRVLKKIFSQPNPCLITALKSMQYICHDNSAQWYGKGAVAKYWQMFLNPPVDGSLGHYCQWSMNKQTK